MAKARSKSSSKRKTKGMTAPISDKSISIKKANNGYVVNMWTDKGETTFIAKNEAEATRYIKKLL
jgi:hypothetical protein